MTDSPETRNAPHRRVSDRGSRPPTVIGPGVSFRGDIIAPGSVVLAGTVRGDGDIGGMLSIAREAMWEGKVVAGAAVIAGKLIGSLEVSGALEVGQTAHIKGQVSASRLAI